MKKFVFNVSEIGDISDGYHLT